MSYSKGLPPALRKFSLDIAGERPGPSVLIGGGEGEAEMGSEASSESQSISAPPNRILSQHHQQQNGIGAGASRTG